MVTRSTRAEGQTESKQIGTLVGALGGLALALALAGGIGGWNLAHQRDAGTTAVQPAEVAPEGREVPRAFSPLPTVWVVSTQEQADLMRDGLTLADVVGGTGPAPSWVVVAGTDTANPVLQALHDDLHIGRAHGAAAMQVVDLTERPAASAVVQGQAGTPAGAGTSARARDVETSILYVARSQEQGVWAQSFSYELGQVSGHPVSVGMVVLTDEIDSAALERLPRPPGLRITDLR